MYLLIHAASAYGNEFFIGFMRNTGGNVPVTNLRLVIGTPQPKQNPIGFVVETSDRVIYEGNVNTSTVVVNIPKELQIISSSIENRQKGIRVYTLSQNDEIFVLVESFIGTINYGIFLAYPCGFEVIEERTSFEYRIISIEDQLHSEFLLVGCYNDTVIEIIPAQSVHLPINLQTQNDSEVMTVNPGSSYHAIIHQMQTLLVLSVRDLTGTKVISNKPLTVISGHECARVPSSASGCEPFAVQIPPIAVWGNRFLLAPFAGRTGAQMFKAISSVDNTNFSYICNNSAHVIQNHILEINTSHYCYLEASKPAFVVQFSVGQDVDNRGDTAIAPISPIENYIHETELITLPEFQANYISITVSAEHFDRNSIKLDGTTIDCTWNMIYNLNGDIVGYGCSVYLNSSESYTKYSVQHSGENGLLSVLTYGFKFPEPIHEGYAYLAGMSYHHLLPISNINTTAEDEVTRTVAVSGTQFTETTLETTESDSDINSPFPLVHILAGALVAVITLFFLSLIGVLCCYHYKGRKP